MENNNSKAHIANNCPNIITPKQQHEYDMEEIREREQAKHMQKWSNFFDIIKGIIGFVWLAFIIFCIKYVFF